MNFYEQTTYSYSLFPTLVCVYDSVFMSEVEQIYPIIKQAENEDRVEYCNAQRGGPSVTSYAMGSFIETLPDDIRVPLSQKLQHCIDDYCTKSGEGDLAVANSWFNIQYEGSSLHEHMHPGSIISGALYVKVDDDNANLRFKNINPFWMMSHRVQETEYNCSYEEFEPKNGTLILFPSWLPHSSVANKSKERVVLSFNTTFYKK